MFQLLVLTSLTSCSHNKQFG
uniref:Uncharacterized protein n=1 Tax=Anguilla anguilla TaxID=7936 RepID=A0A0E9S794_ANGAN